MKMKLFLIGCWRSRTVWSASALALLGTFETEFGLLAQYVQPKTYAHVLLACGLLMFVLRALTRDGLIDKASAVRDSPAQSQSQKGD